MKRALLAVLLLAACEKDHGAHIHREPPRVGDRVAYHTRYDSHLTAPDGTEHAGHAETSMTTEVLAVADRRIQRMRIIIDRDDHVFDGVPKPHLAGTYELTAAGELTRANGVAPTDYERSFFAAWHIGNDDSALAARELRAGDTVRPSPTEVVALGLPEAKGPWELHVKRADNEAIVLTGDYEPVDSPPEVESRATTTVTLTDQSRTHVTDLVITWNGKQVGGAHSTFELVPKR